MRILDLIFQLKLKNFNNLHFHIAWDLLGKLVNEDYTCSFVFLCSWFLKQVIITFPDISWVLRPLLHFTFSTVCSFIFFLSSVLIFTNFFLRIIFFFWGIIPFLFYDEIMRFTDQHSGLFILTTSLCNVRVQNAKSADL